MRLTAPFKVTKRGSPIDSWNLKDTVNHGIAYSRTFAEFDAAIKAGATLDELHKWLNGGYPTWFMAYILSWAKNRVAIDAHIEEAIGDKMKQKRR